MKHIFVFLIGIYQLFLSPFLHQLGVGGCRYPVSCSQYAKEAIEKHGIWQGGMLSLKRLSTCHPLAKY